MLASIKSYKKPQNAKLNFAKNILNNGREEFQNQTIFTVDNGVIQTLQMITKYVNQVFFT